jgi:hypothetical protein
MLETYMDQLSRENLAAARGSYRDGRLALFVGAGVSKSCKVPLLQELAEKVVEAAWRMDRGTSRAAVLAHRRSILSHDARTALRLASERLKDQFLRNVYNALYGSMTTLPLSDTVKAITELDNVHEICCTNYDNALELAFNEADLNCSPVTSMEKFDHPDNGTIIYHPHGYLPFGKQPTGKEPMDIILSEDSYYREALQPYSWPNMVQLLLFLTRSVLFVGCSLTDPDTLRLLYVASSLGIKRKHFALMINPTFKLSQTLEKDVVEAALWAETDLLQKRGVYPIWYNDHKLELPKHLRSLRG